MDGSGEIKKEIRYGSLIIRLYRVGKDSGYRNEAVSNIQAFTCQEKLIWKIQPPTFNLSYFDMQMDEEHAILEADSGAGRIYRIDLKNGHIISSKLIK